MANDSRSAKKTRGKKVAKTTTDKVVKKDAVPSVVQRATELLHKNEFEDAFIFTETTLGNPGPNITPLQILELKAVQGIAAFNTKRYDLALVLLEEVCDRPSVNPMLMSGLALTYRMLHRNEDALKSIMYCVNNDSSNYQHFLHGALIATDLNNYDMAMGFLLRAQGLDYKNPNIHLAMAQHLLALKEYEPGWREYEWRDFIPNPGNELPSMTSAPWNGMRLPGGYLLVVCDQGFGDCLQFIRFLPLARQRVEKLILACSKELYPLFKDAPGADEYFTEWVNIPPHAAHCRLSSLPCLLNLDDETQFSTGEAYLKADPERKAFWAERLADTCPVELPSAAPKIGLIWQGRRTHSNDTRRSLPLSALLPLSEIPNCRFVCLQKPVPDDAVDYMSCFTGFHDWSEELTDYGETAALVSNLDLVISIDSSIAHLAGALGVPTWVLLPQPAEWRWGIAGTKTPWYPQSKLFRQPEPGCWGPVIEKLHKNIRDLIWVL